MGIGEAHRLHRAVTQSLASSLGHDLDRQAAVEIRRSLPFLETHRIASDQRIDEGVIIGLAHRAVDVVLASSAGPYLVIARLVPADVHIDAVAVNDRGDGIEEG